MERLHLNYLYANFWLHLPVSNVVADKSPCGLITSFCDFGAKDVHLGSAETDRDPSVFLLLLNDFHLGLPFVVFIG